MPQGRWLVSSRYSMSAFAINPCLQAGFGAGNQPTLTHLRKSDDFVELLHRSASPTKQTNQQPTIQPPKSPANIHTTHSLLNKSLCLRPASEHTHKHSPTKQNARPSVPSKCQLISRSGRAPGATWLPYPSFPLPCTLAMAWAIRAAASRL